MNFLARGREKRPMNASYDLAWENMSLMRTNVAATVQESSRLEMDGDGEAAKN